MIKGFIMDRIIAFIMVLGSGVLLLATLIMSTLITSINGFISERFFDIPVPLLKVLNIIVSLVIIYTLLLLIFKFLPSVRIRWKHASLGAVITSVLFVTGQYFISLYLGTSSLSSTYGAAGSLVFFLLWIYYSSQILYLGAEIIQVYVTRSGEIIIPKNKFVKFENPGNPVES